MKILKGIGVSRGIAIGKVVFHGTRMKQVERKRTETPDKEIARYEQARKAAGEKLTELRTLALATVGAAEAEIFDVHGMMLEDEDYHDSVINLIRTNAVNAEYAVARTGENFSEMFMHMDDDYMRARAADVRDITERLLCELDPSRTEKKLPDDSILCSDDLSPSDTVRLDKKAVAAFVMRGGSAQSHTSILARTMAIPAVIGVGDSLSSDDEGHIAIVDSQTGEVILDPDEKTLSEANRKRDDYLTSLRLEEGMKGKENRTLDGRRIELFANVGSLSDIGLALQNDAGGIGLFRSEFLYLESEDYPSEEKQFASYKSAVEKMAGKPVIIRTLDIGADKKIGYFGLPEEENPALGWRAVRICLDRPELFRTQLRALCRASCFGNLSVMVPMVTSVWEVREVKKHLREVQRELRAARIPYDPLMPLGIMIETPAAALLSDELAKEVDFFSIGTNDLSGYTLAADRQNGKIGRFFDPHHPAILRLIDMTVRNAHHNGIWCGICGELGADTELTELFLEMGLDELSMSPSSILRVRKKVRETDLSAH